MRPTDGSRPLANGPLEMRRGRLRAWGESWRHRGPHGSGVLRPARCPGAQRCASAALTGEQASKPASPGLPSTLHPPLGAGSGGGKPGNREADVLARCCRWAWIPARTAPLSRSCHHFKALIKVLRVDALALKPQGKALSAGNPGPGSDLAARPQAPSPQAQGSFESTCRFHPLKAAEGGRWTESPWHSSLPRNPHGRAGSSPRRGDACSAEGPGDLCSCAHGAHTRLLSEVILGFSLSESLGLLFSCHCFLLL